MSNTPRPVLYTRVNGIVYNKNGEMEEIDQLEQGTGAAVFTAYDDGIISGKVFGEINAVDVANILFILRRHVGKGMFDLAMAVVDKAERAFPEKGVRKRAV